MSGKKNVLIVGAGQIGLLVASLLADSQDYQVYLGDKQKPKSIPTIAHNPIEFFLCDVFNRGHLIEKVKQLKINGIISCLPHNLTLNVAKIADITGLYYFDLTEDVKSTEAIYQIAENSEKGIFVQQCGLAPGLISIIAHNIMQQFSELRQVKMRVGALPINISNPLQYAFTWSTEGLINEYVNSCPAIVDHNYVMLPALHDLEKITINGISYEAFNTSGGLGSLAITYAGKVRHMNYKTIRYPGHCNKMKFLLQDLKFCDNQETLIQNLEKVIPRTSNDLVLIYVSVEGIIDNQLSEKHYTKYFYPTHLYGHQWTAIQMTTGCSLCVSIDLVMKKKILTGKIVRQEQIDFIKDFLPNQFASYFRKDFLPNQFTNYFGYKKERSDAFFLTTT